MNPKRSHINLTDMRLYLVEPSTPTPVRHADMAAVSLRRAIGKAAQHARDTGVRHRVTVCTTPPEDHLVPIAWQGLHYVIEPTDTPVDVSTGGGG